MAVGHRCMRTQRMHTSGGGARQPGAELQGGPCGPRTTLRSAQPRPIGRVSTRPVARDLADSTVCSSRTVLFPYFAWCAVQSWGRSTAATQLLAAASTAIAHRTPTTDIVISTSANAKQQLSRSRHSELLCQR